ncbi:MAG: type I methionyl aminopeptidase [Ignavibacteria bacterium]|nr:type I methionyl aminopeptidase [Ignavibacteria bacterium]
MIFIKNAQEIDGIRKSCQIVSEVLKMIGEMIKPGITTKMLDQAAEDYIRSRGAVPAFKGYSQAGSFNFPASICASIDDAVVHGIPNDEELKEGQIISIDVGVQFKGYFGDAARTFPVGKISELKKKLVKVTEESLYKGIDKARNGNRVSDISRAIQNYVESNGFSIVRELTGHGVGKYLHEDPSIPNYVISGPSPRLKEGMTLAIEPMVNAGTYRVKTLRDGWTIVTEDGQPSAHFEHTILITKNEPEILTA